MGAFVQPVGTLPAYMTAPLVQKEPAAPCISSALRFSLGRRCAQARLNVRCSSGSAPATERRAASTAFEERVEAAGALTMKITRCVEETVFPVPSHHPALHELSEVDQLLSPHVSAPILMFFTAAASGDSPPSSPEEKVRALKCSLSQALAIFYPMAGRLVRRSGSASRFDVSCLDQGALFSEAWADCPLSFFHPDFQQHPSFHLLTPIPFSSVPDALLYIQVTHFTCGGFCICVQERHILSDGVSLFHFLKSWVEILNGKQGLTLYPYMDLSILRDGYKLNNLSMPSSQYAQNFLQSPPIDFDTQKHLTFTSKIFHFTPNFIEALRKDVKLLRNSTSYECIVAYLWQNVTRAHKYSPNENTRLAFPVDIRKRLRPCLPSGYFGNALLTGFAYAKVEDLVAKQGMSYAMSLVRDAIYIMKSDYMKLALDWLGKQQSPPLFSVASAKSLFANSWTRIPFGDLNFPWGKPCCFRTHLPPNLAGEFVLILPSPLGKGHLDVQVNLQCEHMLKFQDLII